MTAAALISLREAAFFDSLETNFQDGRYEELI